ncbi:uncharacterized protein LOC128223987 [Mya arenaria]|uniref:uncharacterized protein LOC128223987 n=1 Tax=Mya arenaria TaxID=6604 RepID=UPI0022E3F165|nr:uncharacterized protein LOC128223987 [Mya arenaria]
MEFKMDGYEMLFLFLGFVFISVQAVPAPGRGALKGYCITSDDCKKGECCISFNGKSVALSPDLRKFVDGKCEQLGSVGDSTCGERECSQSDDCQKDECCVSKFRRRGKRSLDSTNQPGTCKPMGTYNSNCLVSNGSGRPKGVAELHCPCSNSLTCLGIGIRDIPLGELGKCSSRRPFGGYN